MIVKVLHGAVRYRVPRPHDLPGHATRSAFRGMTVDIPDAEAQRLLDLGAVVAPEQELPRAGSMRPLPEKASAEELKAWVSVATDDEIDQACEEHPHLADRIRDARAGYEVDLAAQNELQGGVTPQPDGQLTNGESDVSVSGTGVTQPVGQGDSNPADDGSDQGGTPTAAGGSDEDEVTDEELDDLVSGTVPEISAFLSNNPDLAQRVLDAETRRANAADEDLRKGVVTAAQVAAAHTG